MGLFDNFKPAAQVQQQQGAAPTQQPSANTNPTVPSTSNTPISTEQKFNADGTPASNVPPLGEYQKLWENDPNAKPNEPFSFNSDPAKLLETAKTVDFTKVLTPELQKRIQAGGADGQAANMEAMNTIAQLTFAQSAHASSKIVEQALQSMEERFNAALPDIIKRHSVAETVRSNNPLLTNPAMAPLIEALQQQMTRKFPQATAAEIKDHVNDYLNGAADLIASGRPVPESKNKGRPQENWEKFFTE